ncbi:hypothetical protein GCM10027340_20640 [Marinomonas epiphytica]
MLSMAKGKVRCGQCFHIFTAQDHQLPEVKSSPQNPKPTPAKKATHTATSPKAATAKATFLQQDDLEDLDLPVNPEWLDTLFDDEEPKLADNKKPASNTKPAKKSLSTSPSQQETPKKQKNSSASKTTSPSAHDEPAPWELELAEVEAALSSQPISSTAPAKPKVQPKAKPAETPTEQEQPDYMVALQSLAQTASEQQPKPAGQHSALEQLSAQQNLAPLLEEEPKKVKKKGLTWLWLTGSLAGLLLLAGQVTMHFFEQGSNSATFRGLYRTICTYTGCILPAYEDVNAISIQHVRIQSHPSQANVLLVNAIITNNSPFSQAMPNMALEFFDLNGAPVAARLFAPNNYLHKDFLDITYMPPNTPIHVVISIKDPGANAVTHQLKALPANTQAY